MTFKLYDVRPCLGSPHVCSAVITRSNYQLAIRTERRIVDDIYLSAKDGRQVACVGIPYPHNIVFGSPEAITLFSDSQNQLAVGTEYGIIGDAQVPLQSQQLFPCDGFPYPRSAVITCSNYRLA